MAKIKPGKNGSSKETIIKKAAALFKEKGYKATSMRELAETLNIEAPSLYNHIGSKSELLQDVCFKIAETFTINLGHIEKMQASIINKIEALIRFHIKMMFENFNEVFVANHEWKHLQEPFFTDFLNQRRNYEKRLVMLLERGIQKKELEKNNSYIVVLTILSAVRGLEFLQRNKKNISAKVLEDTMVSQLLNGIVK
jgi:AcrR family transcriptional regulator